MTPSTTPTKPDGILTKRRLGLAGGAAVAACVACCTVPLLVAAGVGGGTLATIAGFLGPGAELVAGGGVLLAVLGVAAVRARRDASAAGCERSCAVEPGKIDGPATSSACGCGPSPEGDRALYRSPKASGDAPVVCTADLADGPTIQGQIDGYRVIFANLRATERFENGFRWVFRNEQGLEHQLEELARNEHRCCSFFDFAVSASGQQAVWEVRAKPEAASVLEFFSRMPERLREETRRGKDVAHLKAAADAAGLGFAADEKRWG